MIASMSRQGHAFPLAVGLMMTLLFASCSDPDAAYNRGMDALRQHDTEKAEKSFEESIRQGTNVWESHRQLGQLAEQREKGSLLALWHYQQCLADMPASHPGKPAVEADYERCKQAVLTELGAGGAKQAEEALKMKIRLLEEFAQNQKRWIEELQRENTDYRKRL